MSSASATSLPGKPEISHVPSASVARRIFRSQLSEWTLHLGWSTVLLLHAVCTVFYACAAWVYHVAPGTNLWWLPNGLELSIRIEHYPTVAIVHLVVAIVHGVLALRMLLSSLLSRKLVYRLKRNKVAPPSLPSASSIEASRMGKTSLRSLIPQGSSLTTTDAQISAVQTSLRDRVKQGYEALAGRYGLLGVENAHYDSINLMRELLQTLWQTYQAYWMSVLLTRKWLNNLYVACIVVNCWSTPLVHFAIKKSGNVLKERVVLLATDIVLDLITTVVLPSALFVPYYQDFNVVIKDFPQANWYDPKWFINMIFEFQLLFVQSWRDLAFRMCFAANLLGCMDVVKSLLEETPRKRGRSRSQQQRATAAVEPKQAENSAPEVVTDANNPAREPPTREARLQTFAYGVLVMLGLLVLLSHLQANFKSSSSLCVQEVHPWFTRKPACFYFELNCARANVSGSAPEIDLLLDEIDALVLASFDIVHCPALELSAKLKSFPRLIVLTVSFSNIVRWDSTASLTGASHPHLRNLNFYGTNFTNGALPEGILSSDPLSHLTQVNIVYANLERLPDDLDAKWPNLAFFYCEMTQLTEFPAVLTKSPAIVDLSLVGNQIREIPSEIFANNNLYGLYLNANSDLSELPAGGDQKLPEAFMAGEFYGTNLSTLPEYVDEAFFQRGGYFIAGGTPLCVFIEKQFDDNGELAGVLSNVDCTAMSSDRLTVIPFFRIKATNLPPVE